MYSVIVVDDEKFVRKGLIGMIDWESNGFQVIGEADNGEDALALISAQKPDLAITDIRMPALDGIELIQAASARKLETEFLIISGHNDFRYAQQAVRFGVLDYVLKPIDRDEILKALSRLKDKLSEKRQVLESRNKRMDEKKIEALIRGELGESDLQEWEKPWRDAGARSFAYVLVEMNNVLPWNGSPAPPAKDALLEGIREAVLAAASVPEEWTLYAHRRAIGLIVPDHILASYDGNMRRFLEALLLRLAERLPYHFRAYAGKPVDTLKQLKDSYQSAKEAIPFKYLKPKDRTILHSDIEGMDLKFMHFEDEAYRKLTEAVEENDQATLRQAIDRLFAEFREKRFSPEAMKTAIAQCVLGIVKSIRSADGEEKELESMEAILNWQDYNVTLEELRRLFGTFAAEASELLSKLYRMKGRGGIPQIKSYVDQNYHKNISLKSISAQFYVNSAYLGQLFKKNYGVYFNEYLQQLRISEAKRLLRQQDLRVYEIAERVGFQNADYFVTVFEKVERMTPTEYRNRLNNR